MESNVYDNNTGFEVCLLKKNQVSGERSISFSSNEKVH